MAENQKAPGFSFESGGLESVDAGFCTYVSIKTCPRMVGLFAHVFRVSMNPCCIWTHDKRGRKRSQEACLILFASARAIALRLDRGSPPAFWLISDMADRNCIRRFLPRPSVSNFAACFAVQDGWWLAVKLPGRMKLAVPGLR
jgi:hypothetical protein